MARSCLSLGDGVARVNEQLQHTAVQWRKDFRVASRVRLNRSRSGHLAPDGSRLCGFDLQPAGEWRFRRYNDAVPIVGNGCTVVGPDRLIELFTAREDQ